MLFSASLLFLVSSDSKTFDLCSSKKTSLSSLVLFLSFLYSYVVSRPTSQQLKFEANQFSEIFVVPSCYLFGMFAHFQLLGALFFSFSFFFLFFSLTPFSLFLNFSTISAVLLNYAKKSVQGPHCWLCSVFLMTLDPQRVNFPGFQSLT